MLGNAVAQTAPSAAEDVIYFCATESKTFNVLDNDTADEDGSPFFLSDIIVEPSYSDVFEFTEDGLITYSPIDAFVGTDIIIYEIEDDDEEYSIGIITIVIQGAEACVWPGDANDNGVADNKDLLNVGLYYGNIGPDRPEEDIEWDGEYCDDWPEEIPALVSAKFADCNGDGLINASDTLPIIVNYDKIHVFKSEGSSGGEEDPPLYIDFLDDTLYAGDTVTLPLILGSIEHPASNIYGLAFTVGGGVGIIVPGSLRVTFNSGWLGEPGTDLISLNYYDTTAEAYDAGVTRISHISASGYGNIGAVSFVMENDLAGKTNDISAILELCLQDVTTLNDFGDSILVHNGCDSAVVIQLTDAIGNLPQPSEYKIFPNPASDNCTIQFTHAVSGILTVENIYGEVMYHEKINGENLIHLSTHVFPAGTYTVTLHAEQNIYKQKLIIQK